LKQENILITGGCGFVGLHVIDELIAKGYKRISVLDNFFRAAKSFIKSKPVEVIECDIRSKGVLKTIFTGKKFSTVIHLAAIHYIPYCNQNPEETIAVNVNGTQNVLDAAAETGVKRFFLASSAAVYANLDRAFREEDPAEPLDIYGLTKLTNEYQARVASIDSSCLFAIGRLFNAVGAYETNPHLVPELVKRVKESSLIEIGNADPKRDYVHVKDIASGIVALTFQNSSRFDVLNIGSGKCYSVLDVVDGLSKLMNKKLEAVPNPKYMRKVDRALLLADISKMKIKFHWTPKYSLLDALGDALEFGTVDRLQ
jgi:UDP-glucose 4-epimerase